MEVVVDHRKFLELLPWYVNGTLAARERAELEHHLDACLPCNAALKEERLLYDLVQDQDAAPIGPDHGIAQLMQRIDRDEGRHGFSVGMPAFGYGLAATLGGAIVWAFFAFSDGPSTQVGEFTTLSDGTPSLADRIDVVFTDVLSPMELEQFAAELGGVLVSGPSDIGRYTFVLDPRPESNLSEVLESLGTDPRIRFAGRSFIDQSTQTGGEP